MEKYSLHDVIVTEVTKMLSSGKNHITVLLPTGCGKTIIIADIVKSLQYTPFIIVSQRILKESLLLRKNELFANQSEMVFLTKEFEQEYHERINNSRDNTQLLFILYDSTPADRDSLSRIIPPDAKVISFGTVFQQYSDQSENDLIYPFECNIFHSESLIDVRDYITCNDSERQNIVDQINSKANKRERLLYAIKTAPICASPEASPEELSLLQEKIKEKDKLIAEKEETINILKSLLMSVGIPEDDLRQAVEHIKKIKYECVDDESDIVTEKVAEAIAEKSMFLFSRYRTPYTEEYYSSLIKACLSEAVWNKMCPESQSCLITGKIAFQSMLNVDNTSLDFSGVCILASKALDLEVSKRFYQNYVSFLTSKYPQSSWPNALLNKGAVLSDDEFTLGSVKYVVGIDEKGEIRNSYVYRLFIKYAKSYLYRNCFSEDEIREHLRKTIESIENVRTKYRNPAAHRTPLNQVTAKECLDYLIDTYKKLKEILEVIK